MNQSQGRQTTVTTSPNPELLAQTRDSWHRVAEHVLAAGQYADTGKIGLRPAAGGYETRLPLRDGRVLSVVHAELVVTYPTGRRTAPITTLAAAAQFAGVSPGMPASVYLPATPLHLEDPMSIDPASAQRLADWYDLADAEASHAHEEGSALVVEGVHGVLLCEEYRLIWSLRPFGLRSGLPAGASAFYFVRRL